jgi:hypothetical protein
VIDASFRGGAKVGWVNASWPFATLAANGNTLTLSSLGTYTFTPSEVVALEPYGSIPILASGIRINHNRRDYPKNMIFWCMGRRSAVLEEIASTGFRPSGQPIERSSGFPLRWSAVLMALVLWNGLFFLDRALAGWRPQPPGFFSFIALVLVFCAATATRTSTAFQRVVLREGHEIAEIKSFLVLLQIVTGIMSVGFGISLLGVMPANNRWRGP